MSYILTDGCNNSFSAREILQKKADSVNISKLSYVKYCNDSLPVEKHDQLIKVVTAQAMLQGLGGGQTESALDVSPLEPRDFTSSINAQKRIKDSFEKTRNSDTIGKEDDRWYQNSFITPESIKTHIGYNPYKESFVDLIGNGPVFDVYQTDKLCYNDMTVMLIHGIESPPGTPVEEIIFMRKGFEGTPMENINLDNDRHIFNRAILLKKDDFALIRFRFKNYNTESRVRLLGYTCHVIGFRHLAS